MRRPFPEAGTAQYNQLRASIVNYLVQNQVIKDKAAEMNVTVTDKAFQDRIKQIITQVGGQKKLDKLLKQQSVTQAQLEAQLKAQMLQDAVQQKVYAGIKVSQADIEKYFNNPANKSQFNVPESVDARHILVKTKAEAEKVRALLEADNSDANWKKVAKQYSTDSGSKNNGGSLGNFPKGRMVKPFEDAAFALKVGQISQPVKSQFGYHVIEVTKKTPGSKQTLAQAKATIEQQLKYQKQSTAWETWLKKAMAAAGIAYAAGFNPATLTASPSPAASAPAASGSPARKEAHHARRAAAMSLTLVYIGAAAGLAPAASLRALSGGGAVFVPAGLEGELRELVAEAADPGFGRLLELDPADGEGLDDLVRARRATATSSWRSPAPAGRSWRGDCAPARPPPAPPASSASSSPSRPARPSTTPCSARSSSRSSASSTCCAWSAPGTASRRRRTSSATPWRRSTSWPTPSPPATCTRSTASSATCCCRSCCSPSC